MQEKRTYENKCSLSCFFYFKRFMELEASIGLTSLRYPGDIERQRKVPGQSENVREVFAKSHGHVKKMLGKCPNLSEMRKN